MPEIYAGQLQQALNAANQAQKAVLEAYSSGNPSQKIQAQELLEKAQQRIHSLQTLTLEDPQKKEKLAQASRLLIEAEALI